MTRPRAAAALSIAIFALAALPALASTSPGKQERAIVGAFKVLLGRDARKVDIKGVRITSIPNESWAIAYVDAKPAYQATFQGFYGLAVKVPARNGKYRWVVADYGTAFVGCGVAPVAVISDLTRTKNNPCPPGAFEN